VSENFFDPVSLYFSLGVRLEQCCVLVLPCVRNGC